MNLNKIEKLLNEQDFPVIKKKPEFVKQTQEIFLELGVKDNSEFYELYTKYFISNIGRSDCSQVIDPLPPEGFSAKYFQEVWEIPKNYILFSTGEGEGGYLYNTEDNTVWDFNLGQQQELLNGTLPHWKSFYEFMKWYLTIEEND